MSLTIGKYTLAAFQSMAYDVNLLFHKVKEEEGKRREKKMFPSLGQQDNLHVI